MNCPLCSHHEHVLFDQDKFRSYYQCQNCYLVFVPRDALISPLDEKKRYDTHNNTDNDPRYENYLQKIADAVISHLRPGSSGLDYGCGESQLLETLFRRKGFKTDSYDLYFLPEERIWERKYDFIILSEVIEHLREPREAMLKLKELLNPEGQFFIKTKLYSDDQNQFKNWFYKRDPTHIQFFNQKSLENLSHSLRMNGVSLIGEDLFLIN